MINMPSCDDRFTLLDGKTQVELFTSFPHFCGRKVEPPSPVEIQDAMQAVTVSYLSSAHPGSVWIELAVRKYYAETLETVIKIWGLGARTPRFI